MSIDPFTKHGVFGPEAAASMGEAFDAACRELRGAGQFQIVRRIVGQRIIAAARGGELDPVRLPKAALSGLALTKMSPAA